MADITDVLLIRVHSFNYSTSVNVISMHIDANYWLLEHFCKSVKRIISTVITATAKSTYYRSQIMAGDSEISELEVV